MSNSVTRSIDTAVILVAGLGSRLRPLTDDRPKALMDLGGETILGRALRLLEAAGVRDIVLATGYREDQIRRALGSLGMHATCVLNPNYETTQNSISLVLCRAALENKAFFKLDGDVVFQPEVLTRLRESQAELAVAVDASGELDAEAMKVRAQDGRITAFGKAIPLAEAHAETIGIELLSARAGNLVLNAIERARLAGDVGRYYEDFYSELVERAELSAGAVDVSDLAWSEVDDHEDLRRARALCR